MAELDKKRNTDVPGSIAGYYYQILLACKEISRYGEVEEVGVETGADVNVVSISKDIVNIEAKLHQGNFGKEAEDIVKTIYNFYTAYNKDIKKLIFTTNTSPTRECKDFFNNWGNNGNEERYIKECILRKSVEGKCKKEFEEFCNDPLIKSRAKIDGKKNIDLLIEETLDMAGKYKYDDYAVINPNIEYKDFIGLLKFSFESMKKQDLISEIRNKIKKNIETTILKLSMKPLEADEYDLIINKMIDCFLEVILLNSQNKSNLRVKSKEYIKIIQNYQTIEDKHISKYQIFSCIQSMQEEEEDILKDIRNRALTKEIDILEENYKCVQQMILSKIADSDGYESFAHTFKLKTNGSSGVSEILIKIIYILSIMMTKEHIKIADIEIIFQQGINNIKLQNFIECSYKKSFSSAYRRMEDIVGELISKYQQESSINENQIFIIDADYKNNEKPCDNINLRPEVYDITQSDENYNDFLMFCCMNYKCTKCLDINDEVDYNKFKNGGGNLCKRI
ncbi:hypothetical protein [Lacrimispora saccharolytica]|uniref:Uncharacterized protein n=1 Tax=Lacrimispora saccharolytica (strain ATCC 35040 / DSM 2544 / NRCC 2533 / WM1) TaxID=610130 RepID=D9R1U3_LACSW|nr:hypothetical protein [Lacrimispora saccharolytica]ADL02834.1 hypothetical protein Closa_0191 [[Clostridium] saccharolyticum WM1]QRV18961.1 hypothetical protein I6K70_15920 [Lacrimispora saccharolytica]